MTARKRRGPQEWHPDWSVHPGELIRESLSALGMTQLAAADALGMKASQLNDILAGRRAVGPTTAIRIGALTGMSPRLLVRMQADYDLASALPSHSEQENG